MKRLVLSLVIGVTIALITICITTEILGFVYMNNNLSESIQTELFSKFENKLFLSVLTGVVVGIVIYIESTDLNDWKKVLSYIGTLVFFIMVMIVMKKLNEPLISLINYTVYYSIICVVMMGYITIKNLIIKSDIKKINTKLEKKS